MPASQFTSESPSEIPQAPAVHVMREALGVWECACGAWANYFAALATNASPDGIFEANTRLICDSLDLYGRTAGLLLHEEGLNRSR